MVLDIVSRKDWEALPPTGDIPAMVHPVEHVVFTHNLEVEKCLTDEECTDMMRSLQKKHMDEGAPDIHYNFLIGGNGKAYEGRGWWLQPDKSLLYSEHNGDRLDIAFMGNYGIAPPPPEMWKSAAHLLRDGIGEDYIYREHREHWIQLSGSGIDFQFVTDEPKVDGGFDFTKEVAAPPPEH